MQKAKTKQQIVKGTRTRRNFIGSNPGNEVKIIFVCT